MNSAQKLGWSILILATLGGINIGLVVAIITLLAVAGTSPGSMYAFLPIPGMLMCSLFMTPAIMRYGNLRDYVHKDKVSEAQEGHDES